MLEAVRPAAVTEEARTGAPSVARPVARGTPELRAASLQAPALRTTGLCVTTRRRALLHEVDLAVAPGSLCVVVGPSGVGKSTLLKCFNRLVDLAPGLSVAGAVRIGETAVYGPEAGTSGSNGGLDVDRLRRRVGMLFQQPVVFPKSIYENAIFGLRRVGTSREERVAKAEWPARAEAVLRRVCLWDEVAARLGEPATELSVGQQQRLCLARVLALEPEVLLMDEPTSALDPEATAVIERLALALAGRATVLWVTHDPAQAERLADTLVRLESRDGAGCVASCTPLDRFEKETAP